MLFCVLLKLASLLIRLKLAFNYLPSLYILHKEKPSAVVVEPGIEIVMKTLNSVTGGTF